MQKNSNWAVYRRLLRYVKPFRIALIASMVTMACYSGIDAMFIKLLEPLIDSGFTQDDPRILKWAPLFVIVMLFFRGLFGFASSYGLAWVGTNIVMKLRQELFNKLAALPVSYYDQHTTGEQISKVTFNTEQLSNSVSRAIVKIIQDGAFIIYLLLNMFTLSWQLSLIFLIIGPVVGVAVGVASRRFRKISRRIQNAMEEVTSATEQMLNGHKVVLSYGGTEIEQKRFAKVNKHVRQQTMKFNSANAMASPVIQFIASFALAAVLFVASFDSVVSQLSAGAFTSIVTSMLLLLKPLKNITTVQADFQKGIAAAHSIFEVLDSEGEKDNGTVEVERVKGDITIADIQFTYANKDEPALDGVNLSLPAGQTLALVGRSGSGKSTIASLITRFYDAERGTIMLDGIAHDDYTLASLRKQIALVSQQVVLFNDTIAANIAYGLERDVSDEEVIKAAEAAFAMEFIKKMPDGIHTEVGQNGVMLSGGQRQRIAIARAILRNAPILILDEATSALDTESERHIQQALAELQKDRTCIVIAHRLSTIEAADQIAVIDAGRVIEIGQHQVLLAQQGAYAQLHALQFNA